MKPEILGMGGTMETLSIQVQELADLIDENVTSKDLFTCLETKYKELSARCGQDGEDLRKLKDRIDILDGTLTAEEENAAYWKGQYDILLNERQATIEELFHEKQQSAYWKKRHDQVVKQRVRCEKKVKRLEQELLEERVDRAISRVKAPRRNEKSVYRDMSRVKAKRKKS